MTVEQTTQLLQLILNSVLMVLASGCLLGGAILRQQGLEKALRITSAERFQALQFADNRPAIHRKLRYLQQQARHNHRVILLLNLACLLFIVSTLSLVLRSLVDWVGLIHLSLFAFAMGTGAFLAGILWLLLTFAKNPRGDRPLHRIPNQSAQSWLSSGPRSPVRQSSRRSLRVRVTPSPRLLPAQPRDRSSLPHPSRPMALLPSAPDR